MKLATEPYFFKKVQIQNTAQRAAVISGDEINYMDLDYHIRPKDFATSPAFTLISSD